MLASPRVALLLVLSAALIAPTVNASPLDCITVGYADFGRGLATVILGLQTGIVVGLASSEPGNGLLLWAKIDPVSCTGIGMGSGNSSADPIGTIDQNTAWLPLP